MTARMLIGKAFLERLLIILSKGLNIFKSFDPVISFWGFKKVPGIVGELEGRSHRSSSAGLPQVAGGKIDTNDICEKQAVIWETLKTFYFYLIVVLQNSWTMAQIPVNQYPQMWASCIMIGQLTMIRSTELLLLNLSLIEFHLFFYEQTFSVPGFYPECYFA